MNCSGEYEKQRDAYSAPRLSSRGDGECGGNSKERREEEGVSKCAMAS
jgi:hypothetical protein